LEIPEFETYLCRVAEKHGSIGQISFDIISSKSTLSKEVLDTFGNDAFSGSQDLAIVGCPRNRTGCWILFTAIVATLLVEGPGCNLIRECRDENGDSVIRRP
jgi:hypothetical protein